MSVFELPATIIFGCTLVDELMIEYRKWCNHNVKKIRVTALTGGINLQPAIRLPLLAIRGNRFSGYLPNLDYGKKGDICSSWKQY
jgi:hypothetical protein